MVRISQHRDIPAIETIKSCTVSKKAGKYYVSVLVEYEEAVQPVAKDGSLEGRAIGLDYSVPDFYVDSNGHKPDFPKPYYKAQRRLARLQRRLSRKGKGSANRGKAKLKLQAAHDKVARQRADFCHKESRRLVDAYDVVCLEDINLRGMSRGLRLGKSVMDGGFGMFRQFLGYKMARKGGYVVYVDKWFPSSKRCGRCGYINKGLTLSDREWACPECGARHSRDWNAAVNIKEEGLRILMGA